MDLEKHHSPVTVSVINIPDDLLIADVLARLPVKSIARFKCVQKSWLATTKNAWFVRRHLRFSRAVPPDVLIIPREDCSDDEDEDIGLSNEINFYRLQEPLGKDFDDILAELMLEAVRPEVITHNILPTHCDGLVAIATAVDQVYVSNPWQITDNPPHAICPAARPVFMRGAFYWCADGKLDLDVILRFSLHDGKFGLVPFPPGCHRGDLAELAGKLCFVHAANEDIFGIWQLADDGPEPAWSLRCRIDVFFEEIGSYGLFPVLSRGRKMLLAVDNEKLYQYYEWSETMLEVLDMGKDLDYERQDGSKLTCGELDLALYHVVPYVESLVSIRAPNY
ncbi:hypothetical protein E2562_007117 [Oryza meyeriana var. granulata]|uniref:F-box domain-containing protein n=1 Tax=Oryza meyeriana var. granulata TaxID=110450 RepID=A0A6G1F4Z0_9ORYZ|nr:hypothetical protein E2562_007117 [Oryza meyeriana var. granulata]